MKSHRASRLLAFVLLSLAGTFATGRFAWADSFMVNNAGSGADSVPGDGNCRTATNVCTLEAAIGEANQRSGTHTIGFAVPTVTLTAPLPAITAQVVINGSIAPTGRVDIDGNGQSGGIQLAETATMLHPNGARGSMLDSLVVRNFNGNGITLSGHGYTISNCYVGVTADGLSASGNANNGIDVSGTIVPPSIPNLPVNFDWTLGQIAVQLGVLFATVPPNTITLSVVSGNDGAGIVLHGNKTAMNIVTANFVGTSADALIAIPNGNSGGGSHPGIHVDANAFANVIGPGNVISGNNVVATDDGVDVTTGSVVFPNFIAGNSIGLGAIPAVDVGNGGSGIKTDTYPDVDGMSPDNPTGYSLFILGNIISDNKGANAGGPDSPNGPNAGIAITGASARVKVTANLIGLGNFGGVLSLLPDFGNAGDGIYISTSDHEIGGPAAPDFNVITGNGRHGVMIGGNNTTKILLRNNFIGIPDPTMAGVLNLGNAADGIHIDAASSNAIGGAGSFDSNLIAANGRHGIALRKGATNNGWSNLFQRNRIYGNTGLGIDLERIVDAADPIPDPLGLDPNTNYANYGQNQPWICSQKPADPMLCGAAALPTASAAGTTLNWTLTTSPNATIRVEFFARAPDGQTFLDERTVTTDAAGLVTSAECIAGLCTSTVGNGIATAGQLIELTATDVTMQDIPPVGDAVTGPANNTSEFSNAVAVVSPGEIAFQMPVYTVNEGAVTATITVNRVNGMDGAVDVDFATADGTATAPADYATAGAPPPLHWNDQDATPKTFTVSIAGDQLYEPGGDETVLLALSNPTNGAVLGAQATAELDIVDDDTQPTISIDDVSDLEGDSGATAFVFTVGLSNPSSQPITVVADTTDGTATIADSDYAPVTMQTITFAPGETSHPVTVGVNGDMSPEPVETFTVDLSAPSNATIADAQGIGTIVDDDAAGAVFTIDNVTANEGNAGLTAFVFTITRSQATGAASVDFATLQGTATVIDSDFAPVGGTIAFADGVASRTITIQVSGDTKFEPNETFSVVLSNPSAGTSIGQGTGTGTITNDDTQPSIAITDVSQAEGNAGTTPFGFVVSLSNPSSQTITVVADTADGSATVANSDYAPLVAQTITFMPGQTTQPVAVNVNGDVASEPNENFTVNLGTAVNATIADAQGSGTIVDDDSGSVFTIGNVTANEGNAGTTAFVFTVTRSQTTGAASVDFTTADGTATVAGNDYATSNGTLTFADGVATQTVTVNVTGDATFEANEAFTVVLSNPSAGTTIGQGTGNGTITNDDAQPTIAIADVSRLEGNAGTSASGFAVTLSNASSQTVTVVATTADGTATIANSDYAAVTNQTITFAPGTTTQTLDVNVNGDTAPEPNETFNVNLAAPVNATIADAQATGTIVDDDSGSVFAIDSVSANEGDAGSTAFTFTVTRTKTTGAASVNFTTVDGTATTAANDYALASGTLNFADGVATRTITVNVTGDVSPEGNETFTVVLSNPSAGTSIGAGTGTGTIVDDDAAGVATFTIDNASASEGDAGATPLTFTVTRSQTTGTASVGFTTVDGTATTAGNDYATATGTLNFASGVATQTITVDVIGDVSPEGNEAFTVVLSNPSAGTSIGAGTGTGTIVDDDSGAGGSTFAIAGVSAAEGDAGTKVFAFTVTRSSSATAGSVDFATSDGTATVAGNDYVSATGTLSFPTGATSGTIAISVHGDTTFEGNEAFVVTLSNPVGGTIGVAQAIGTIIDDDSSGGGVPGGPVAAPTLDVWGLAALVGLALWLGACAARRRST